jgi:short-subunit dehydrogenase
MRTAIITGASSGLGAELVTAAAERFPDIECFWLIARDSGRLLSAASGIPGEKKTEIISADLTKDESYELIDYRLREDKPEVVLLINAAGLGYLEDIAESTWEKQVRIIDVNVRGLTAITTLVLPYMDEGARIINISSIASFCPNSRMTVYSASKAFVSFFGAGLGDELRKSGITVTTVCPGPMDTAFLSRANISGNSKTFETLPYCDVTKTARGAIKASYKRKKTYTPRAFFKFYRFVAKFLPQGLVIKWART